MLEAAIAASKLTLSRLRLVENEMKSAIQREVKMIERLEFAIRKAKSDAQYYKSVKNMYDKLAAEKSRN